MVSELSSPAPEFLSEIITADTLAISESKIMEPSATVSLKPATVSLPGIEESVSGTSTCIQHYFTTVIQCNNFLAL